TFRPFDKLPAPVRKAYLSGDLYLLPFPGSLVFWGVPIFREMHRALPLALQIPLLPLVEHNRGECHGVPVLRVPQSGLMHRPKHEADARHAPHVRNTYKRTHRWDKILRDQSELEMITKEDPLLHVLFSTVPEDIELYGKPMGRNVQIWT